MAHYTTQKMKRLRKPKPRFPILPAIQERFSPRWFSLEEIPQHDLDIMLEAARWTPSGYNSQPWFFYISEKGTPAYEDIALTLSVHNQWARTAPVFVIACYMKRDAKGDNQFANYDLGAAVYAFVLQATELGYYARQMGLFDAEKLKKVISIDPSHTPFVILALGKLGDYTKIDEELLARELSPHDRKTDIAKRLK
jgi:nitroreductase